MGRELSNNWPSKIQPELADASAALAHDASTNAPDLLLIAPERPAMTDTHTPPSNGGAAPARPAYRHR